MQRRLTCKCITLHTCTYLVPCLALLHLLRVSNSCIQIQTPATFCLFANQPLHWAQFGLTKMVKDTARVFWSLEFSIQFSIWLCIQLTVSRQIWFHIWGRGGECRIIFGQIYSWVPFQICLMHALQCTGRQPAKLAPPAMIYALNNAKPHNVCNQNCISAFSSLNFKPRKHWYFLSGFNGCAF